MSRTCWLIGCRCGPPRAAVPWPPWPLKASPVVFATYTAQLAVCERLVHVAALHGVPGHVHGAVVDCLHTQVRLGKTSP